MHWRERSMSGRSALGGMSDRPSATLDRYAPSDSISSTDGDLDALRFGDLAALCFALAAFACPFILIGFALVIWSLFVG